jgi:hypothetical protein
MAKKKIAFFEEVFMGIKNVGSGYCYKAAATLGQG